MKQLVLSAAALGITVSAAASAGMPCGSVKLDPHHSRYSYHGSSMAMPYASDYHAALFAAHHGKIQHKSADIESYRAAMFAAHHGNIPYKSADVANYHAAMYAAHHGNIPYKSADEEKVTEPVAVASGDLVDVASDAGSFNTLLKAAQAAGLEQTLRGEGPFTVFAPTDDAFSKLPEGTIEKLLADKESLARVLKYHVIPGKYMAADLIGKTSLATVEGSLIESDMLQVSETDIVAENGVIHVIDAVLIPQS